MWINHGFMIEFRTISVWIIAAFTIERFVVVYFPFVQRRIRFRHTVGVIVAIVILAFAYNITIPTIGFKSREIRNGPHAGKSICSATKFFIKFNNADM